MSTFLAFCLSSMIACLPLYVPAKNTRPLSSGSTQGAALIVSQIIDRLEFPCDTFLALRCYEKSEHCEIHVTSWVLLMDENDIARHLAHTLLLLEKASEPQLWKQPDVRLMVSFSKADVQKLGTAIRNKEADYVFVRLRLPNVWAMSTEFRFQRF